MGLHNNGCWHRWSHRFVNKKKIKTERVFQVNIVDWKWCTHYFGFGGAFDWCMKFSSFGNYSKIVFGAERKKRRKKDKLTKKNQKKRISSVTYKCQVRGTRERERERGTRIKNLRFQVGSENKNATSMWVFIPFLLFFYFRIFFSVVVRSWLFCIWLASTTPHNSIQTIIRSSRNKKKIFRSHRAVYGIELTRRKQSGKVARARTRAHPLDYQIHELLYFNT